MQPTLPLARGKVSGHNFKCRASLALAVRPKRSRSVGEQAKDSSHHGQVLGGTRGVLL